jgi:chromosome segregation ATPase
VGEKIQKDGLESNSRYCACMRMHQLDWSECLCTLIHVLSGICHLFLMSRLIDLDGGFKVLDDEIHQGKKEAIRLKKEKEDEIVRLQKEREEEVMRLKKEREEEVMRLKKEKEEAIELIGGKISRIEDEVAELCRELAETMEELVRRGALNVKLEGSLRDAERRMSDESAQRHDLEGRLRDESAQRHDLEGRLKDEKTQRGRAALRLKTLEGELEEKEKDIDRVKAVVASLGDEVERLERDKAASRSELDDAREACDKLDSLVLSFKREMMPGMGGWWELEKAKLEVLVET